MNSQPSDKPQSKENPWVETGKTIGLAVVLALGIRTFVAEARYIPSGSMLPTLEINDRLIVDKVSYRFSQPQRGDIVVFNVPDGLKAELKQENEKEDVENVAFIKRIIGLPGDRVQTKQGKVYVNGKLIAENYILEPAREDWNTSQFNTDGSEKIPEGQYLVLGDNRNNSRDSHYWGFLPHSKILGKAVVRFWPIDRAGGINPQPNYK
jgi:signal peptidase I